MNKIECPTINLWTGLYKVINDYFDVTTIEYLVHDAEEHNDDFCYYI